MMNDIVLIFLKSGAQVVGEDVTGLEKGVVLLKNPVLIVNNGASMSFLPMMNFVEDDTATISRDDLLLQNICTPVLQLKNEYNRIFGSGIQIASSMSLN